MKPKHFSHVNEEHHLYLVQVLLKIIKKLIRLALVKYNKLVWIVKPEDKNLKFSNVLYLTYLVARTAG